jgi:uncharacterized metal-binding protein
MAPGEPSRKRIEEEERQETERKEERKDDERRTQQNVTQGMNTGTEDVHRVSDWGSTHSKKKKNGKEDKKDKK